MRDSPLVGGTHKESLTRNCQRSVNLPDTTPHCCLLASNEELASRILTMKSTESNITLDESQTPEQLKFKKCTILLFCDLLQADNPNNHFH